MKHGRNGTSKKVDIELMNFLGITPNILYRDFIVNENLKKKIFISEHLENVEADKLNYILQIIDIIKKL